MTMKMKRKTLLWLMTLGLLFSVYPAFVLLYTWSCVFRSDLQGGRNGPLDAYRHTLASSVVSYTLGKPTAVNLVTRIFESKGKDSNAMDSHNNRIGAGIGSNALAFRELEPRVHRAVMNGTVNAADPNQITWLPESKWRNAQMW